MVDAQDDVALVLRRSRWAGRPVIWRSGSARRRARRSPSSPRSSASASRFQAIVDTLAGAIIKRLRDGRRDGVAVIAEGVVLGIDPSELAEVGELERDEHGHPRLAEIDIGQILQARRAASGWRALGLDDHDRRRRTSATSCAAPTRFRYDMEYTRDLGYCAAQVPARGRQRRDGVDPRRPVRADPLRARCSTRRPGRARVRLVDVASSRYLIARRYMIRLARDDFADREDLESLARVAGSRPRLPHPFEYVTAHEPAPLRLQQ